MIASGVPEPATFGFPRPPMINVNAAFMVNAKLTDTA
jgi:hypothetical protein